VNDAIRTIIWQQLGAAIDMLENALRACPDELWSASLWKSATQPAGLSEFWYLAYHTLFWLDLYLTGSAAGFTPPAPFTLAELDPQGLLPDRKYTKAELLAYLEHGRRKSRAAVEALTDERARQLCSFSWGETMYAGLLLDNMRHVQEHTAQLNMYLGQTTGWSPHWVGKTNSGLYDG
jgi:hypothetical protein